MKQANPQEARKQPCANIKYKLKQQQLQQRLQQAQLIRRRMALRTRTTSSAPVNPITPAVPSVQGSQLPGPPGGMSSANVASPASNSSMGGMTSPHQPGIGMKPTTPSPNVLQVVKQEMNMVVQQTQPQQPMPGAMGGMRPQVAPGNGPQMSAVGSVGGITAQQLQSIMQRIKSNPGEPQHLLHWLKSNPQVMAAIIKERQAQGQAQNCAQQQQQGNGPQ